MKQFGFIAAVHVLVIACLVYSLGAVAGTCVLGSGGLNPAARDVFITGCGTGAELIEGGKANPQTLDIGTAHVYLQSDGDALPLFASPTDAFYLEVLTQWGMSFEGLDSHIDVGGPSSPNYEFFVDNKGDGTSEITAIVSDTFVAGQHTVVFGSQLYGLTNTRLFMTATGAGPAPPINEDPLSRLSHDYLAQEVRSWEIDAFFTVDWEQIDDPSIQSSALLQVDDPLPQFLTLRAPMDEFRVTTVIPIPTALPLLVTALGALFMMARRRV